MQVWMLTWTLMWMPMPTPTIGRVVYLLPQVRWGKNETGTHHFAGFINKTSGYTRSNLAHLTASRMVNTMMLVLWRYMSYIRSSVSSFSLERCHLTKYSINFECLKLRAVLRIYDLNRRELYDIVRLLRVLCEETPSMPWYHHTIHSIYSWKIEPCQASDNYSSWMDWI